MISGVQSRPELNGTRAQAVSAAGDRWVVQPAGGGDPLSLKSSCLSAVPDGFISDGVKLQIAKGELDVDDVLPHGTPFQEVYIELAGILLFASAPPSRDRPGWLALQSHVDARAGAVLCLGLARARPACCMRRTLTPPRSPGC